MDRDYQDALTEAAVTTRVIALAISGIIVLYAIGIGSSGYSSIVDMDHEG